MAHLKLIPTKLVLRWKGSYAEHRFRLWASHFLLLRQKKVTKEEATPTIGLFLRCPEKSGTKKNRFAQTVFRSDRFFLPLLGANQRRPT